MKITLLTLLTLLSTQLFAQQLPVQGPSDEQIEAMALHNQQVAKRERTLGPIGYRSANVKHFYEWDKTGYILTSDDDFYGLAEEMKQQLAQNLPQDVTLIVYTQSSSKSYQKQLFTSYSQYIPKERLVVLQVPPSGMNDFWTRDNTPVPVWVDGKFSLVDAQYYYNFEPDAFISQLFAVDMDAHNYFYEGGNMAVNTRGECILVNRNKKYPGGTSDTAAIPDDIFKTKYGCTKIIRFKHLKGIGHTDEVVKFMTDDIVVTDTEEYVDTLKKAGYTVHVLPEAELPYETYVNSLQVNDVLFIPIFGEKNDQKAVDIYKNLNLGLKIVTMDSREISTQGWGSIHCFTMNYPPATLDQIVLQMNGTVVH
ncbi:MAG: agmatine deiminase family protein [Bdellovibrionales bacterium]|nr:agmatine deiminase family protein [Bdellovibrionales bacterium]